MKKAKQIVFILFCVAAVFCVLCIGYAALDTEKGQLMESHGSMTGVKVFGVLGVIFLSLYVTFEKVNCLEPDAEVREDPEQACRDGMYGSPLTAVLSIACFIVAFFWMTEIFVMLGIVTVVWSGCFAFLWHRARRILNQT